MIAEQIERLYWDIGDVAKIFGIVPSNVRFWLTEFDIQVHRSKSGKRKFTKDDLEKVSTIYRLLKVDGLHIWKAKEKFNAWKVQNGLK